MAGLDQDLYLNAYLASILELMPCDERREEEDLSQETQFQDLCKKRRHGSSQKNGDKSSEVVQEEVKRDDDKCPASPTREPASQDVFHLASLKSPDLASLKSPRVASLKGSPEQDGPSLPKGTNSSKGHVFISYSWDNGEIVRKLRERMEKEGVEVWIDVERMSESLLSAMAEAVEKASVVLICVSESYKQSYFCKLEAEYTIQKRKKFIPIIVQKQYRPDGWLGIILGVKLYFDFSGKNQFEKTWNGLMKEIKGMLQNNLLDKTDAPVGSSSSAILSSQPIRQSSFYQMSIEDVSNWLCSLKLDGCVPSFAQFDGKFLAQLKSMKKEAAEFYYHCLEKKLNMNLVQILKFTEGLEKHYDV